MNFRTQTAHLTDQTRAQDFLNDQKRSGLKISDSSQTQSLMFSFCHRYACFGALLHCQSATLFLVVFFLNFKTFCGYLDIFILQNVTENNINPVTLLH